jgi:hypothetical protein
MDYDDRGRLRSEKITHATGRGKIEYAYRGESMEPASITIEDDFYDRVSRTVAVHYGFNR